MLNISIENNKQKYKVTKYSSISNLFTVLSATVLVGGVLLTKPVFAAVSCAIPLAATLQSSAAGILTLDAPTLGSATYFDRSSPANLVVNGDFEDFTDQTLLQWIFNATMIDPSAVSGAYNVNMTNLTTVPSWTAGGGNTSNYSWHALDSVLLGTPRSTEAGAGRNTGGTGYIYLGASAQNLVVNGTTAYSMPYTIDTSPEGRITPPGPVTGGANTYIWRTGVYSHPLAPSYIEQTVALTVGLDYRMTFYVAAEALSNGPAHAINDGIMGLDITGYNREYLTVHGTNNPLTNMGANGLYYTLQFTAKQAATTIRLLSFGHAVATPNVRTVLAAEPTLDDVIINACFAQTSAEIPTLNNWALLLITLMMLAVGLRFRAFKYS